MRHLLARAALLLLAGAGAVAAECRGPSLLSRLSPAQGAALDAAAAAVPFGEGLLWQATRGDRQVVLAGTLHLSDRRHDATVAALRPAIAEADLVLLEATPVETAAMERAMVEEPALFFLTEGPTLPDLLGEEGWARVAGAARARGLPPWTVAKFRPGFLAMALSVPACAMEAAAGSALPGLDGLVIAEAEAAGVPMAPLEGWRTLFELMEAPLDEEVEALRDAVLDPSLNDETMQAMVDLYFDERVAAVLGLGLVAGDFMPPDRARALREATAAMEEGLVLGRNAAWIPVIEAAAATAPRIVLAAGAGHLPGEGGLLRLLERSGWRVAPLAVDACCKGVWDLP